ncbi:hypothetical protein F5Y06DRAFT_305022 [Hypoxylon sp. FL0890]|nr:hypothetical protein F5Y06DRAFT_305022 [Hypoxylon sp. FL0890]
MMSHISNEPDRDAADHDAQLLCHFTMRGRDAAFIANLQVYTRKWLPDLSEVRFAQNTITRPGVLERLPQEIRDMIYDLVSPPRSSYFDFTQQQVYWPQEFPLTPEFSVPVLAYVCREMRQYAMWRYQLVWWSSKRVVSKIHQRGGPVHREETTRSGLGVFRPDKDVIEIHIKTVDSNVELGERAIVNWNDPTQAPTLKELSTRQVSYVPPRLVFCPFFGRLVLQDTFITLIPKQSGMWEKTWKKDSFNKFHATVRKI